MKIRTRLSPSPTGKLHLGNVHTFLFNYAFTKHNGGEMLLRFEDTDKARNQEGSIEDIMEALKWLGLDWDEPFSRQSLNHADYRSFANILIEHGDAYFCYHTEEELAIMRGQQQAKRKAPRYDGSCRSLTQEQINKYKEEGRKPSIRFRMTGEDRPKEIEYKDLVFGDISYNPEDIGDFVIIRSDDSALYNFANVIDDNTAGITHVIRGNSHLTNTPRQIILYQALKLPVPEFGHLPDILNPDRVGKLSKRYGATAVTELRDLGYLPEAVINFLGSLGWSHPEGTEFFDLAGMVKAFEFSRVSKAPPAMDLDKLDFYNAHYLRKLNQERLMTYLKKALPESGDEILSKLAPLLTDRISNFNDVHQYGDYFFKEPTRPEFILADHSVVLNLAAASLASVSDWTKDCIENSLRSAQQSSSVKPRDFFVTIGQAVSGREVFLPLFDSIEILGKEKTLTRLKISL